MNGFIGLTISDVDLDYTVIEKNMCLPPFKKSKTENEVIGKELGAQNMISYQAYFTEENFDEKVVDFLDKILLSKPFIDILKKENKNINMILNLHISSVYGQIGVLLTKEIIRKARELRLGLSLDIISFGMVDA